MQTDFLRYSCQLNLPGFNEAVQKKLQDARVLIAGAGGLGCPAAQYLTAAGVGTIGFADGDTISIGNLHRQILYTPAEVGLKKVVVASQKLQQQNPLINIIPIDKRITSDNVMDIIQQYDIVVDCTDNFETRYLLNDACVLLNKPLVYGAIYQYEGQVSIWNLQNEEGTRTPNYRDVFPEADASQIPDCAEGGVIPTLAGIIGCMQANEAIKFITEVGELLAGKILMLDVLTWQCRVINIGKISAINIQQVQQTEFVPVISAEGLKQSLHKNIFHLIDVRTIEERNEFNIGGTHIPVAEVENDLSYLQNSKPVIFYCASGKRSGEAVKKIKRKFPDANIYSLNGGMKAWREYITE